MVLSGLNRSRHFCWCVLRIGWLGQFVFMPNPYPKRKKKFDAGRTFGVRSGSGPRDAGTLAGRNEVSDSEVASGFALIERGSGPPSASRVRLYQDTDDGSVWFDNGTAVRRLARDREDGSLGSDTSFSSTSYVVVCGPTLTGVNELDWLAVMDCSVQFQFLSEASADTCRGQWAVYLSDTSISIGSAISGASNSRLLWEGDANGLTFQTASGSVTVDENDVESSIETGTGGSGGYAGSTYDGTCYVYLCLRVTSGGGESVNLDGATVLSVILP